MADLPFRYASGTVRGGALVATIKMEDIRDTASAYGLRDEVVSLIESSKATNLVLDLGDVRSIGSIGFLAFLGMRRRLAGGRVVLCNMPEPVRKTFELCRLISDDPSHTAPFEVAGSVEAALARCSASAL